MGLTRSESAAALRASRAELLGPGGPRGAALRAALQTLYDGWLAGLTELRPGVALIAVGALGRGDPAPFSDLDLVLLHDGDRHIGRVAEALWYPIWDAGLSLDHSVRTVGQLCTVAANDAKAALGLLDARFIAGDAGLAEQARSAAYSLWRTKAHTHLPELHEMDRRRRRTAGELAFLLEPDLKASIGGLRDVVVLRALAAAQLADPPGPAVAAARELLLDVRGELQLRSRRCSDVLLQQEQGPVAAALGIVEPDELLRGVAAAGRTIDFAGATAWRAVDAEVARRGRWRSRRRIDRRPLAAGVIEQGGEVVLALAAEPAWEPTLLLRTAAAAAVAGLPLAPYTLTRLAAEAAPMPNPWPPMAVAALIQLLDAGARAVPVIEALDQHGLMSRLIPEWEHVRFRPQHNPVHRFTVDRHLVETAAEASILTRQVARPDLLLLGALFHDIGKGHPGDHSVVGAVLANTIAIRLGLAPADVAIVTALVRHHLLLPDTATRRDIEDPTTAAYVSTAINGSAEVLHLLHALALADARATGPGAWSAWKGTLVANLVARVDALVTGSAPPPAPSLTDGRALAARVGRTAVYFEGEELVIVAPDVPGLLSMAAGLLAVHALDVGSATITTEGDSAVNVFAVTPRFGREPDVDVLRTDLESLLDGRFPLGDRLAALERAYPAPPGREPPRVLWFDDESSRDTIVELRAADRVGLLHRVTAALEGCDLDIRTARISTLGGSVVDAFYVLTAGGAPVTAVGLRSAVEQALLAAAEGGTNG